MKIRFAGEMDVNELASQVVRLKKLNEEFDSMLKVGEWADKSSRDQMEKALKDSVVLVAEEDGRIAGFIKAVVKDRIFYKPRKEGFIAEFYVMPEYRRKNVGDALLKACEKELRKKGAEIITAEFPSQNRIAASFYEKRGFRGMISIYASTGEIKRKS